MQRLYYIDPYLVAFTAAVQRTDADGRRIWLDRSAFYPSSGGQPHDTGQIEGCSVVDVREEEESVVHLLSDSRNFAAGQIVSGTVDWARRFDHMQQHTGQHLLSAVFIESFGAETVSFHMGRDVSTIELATPSLDEENLRRAEQRANELIAENRPVRFFFEEAGAVAGLRKASARTGLLRIVEIEGLDRSACGGTHVRTTGEIGCVLLRGTEKIRGNVRLEFLCGLRAVIRARRDFDLLNRLSSLLSCGIDETASFAGAQASRLADSEKMARRLATELAETRGRQAYSALEPLPSGLRLLVREANEITDNIRAEAQAFVSGRHAVFLVWSTEKPAVLFAVSSDSGLHAGNILKAALTEFGGRGGGSAQMAQGSVPKAEGLTSLISHLRQQL